MEQEKRKMEFAKSLEDLTAEERDLAVRAEAASMYLDQ